jgi:hypothetical protein
MPEDDALIDAAEYLTQLCLSISRSKLEDKQIRLVLGPVNGDRSYYQCTRLVLPEATHLQILGSPITDGGTHLPRVRS